MLTVSQTQLLKTLNRSQFDPIFEMPRDLSSSVIDHAYIICALRAQGLLWAGVHIVDSVYYLQGCVNFIRWSGPAASGCLMQLVVLVVKLS